MHISFDYSQLVHPTQYFLTRFCARNRNTVVAEHFPYRVPSSRFSIEPAIRVSTSHCSALNRRQKPRSSPSVSFQPSRGPSHPTTPLFLVLQSFPWQKNRLQICLLAPFRSSMLSLARKHCRDNVSFFPSFFFVLVHGEESYGRPIRRDR